MFVTGSRRNVFVFLSEVTETVISSCLGVTILRYRNVTPFPLQSPLGTLFRQMDLSLTKLSEALALRQQIDTLERRLSALFAGSGSSASSTRIAITRSRGRRRPMSAATRAKLAAAARARWARQRGGSTLGKVTAGKKRRKLSAAGRKRISDAMKARWAARRKSARR